jgi:NNP family nitrate/nitrite transporter-like MFS transporter
MVTRFGTSLQRIPEIRLAKPLNSQGFALGVYGAGNIGQSLAADFRPLASYSRYGFSLFAWLARNAQRQGAIKSFRDTVEPSNDSRSWVLSLYYFLTFGGSVAVAVYLPIFLTEMFKLTPHDGYMGPTRSSCRTWL